jgi:TetR/AcrR family tetracycline transcriptional repressor
MILDAVLEMLRRDPQTPLTMARAAEVVGASPMSLYRYFDDRDDLIVSATRHVMREAVSSVPDDAPWQERLRVWMMTVYKQAVAHPQLFQLAAFGESPAWLTCSASLAEILENAGFASDRQLGSAVYLIGTITLGQVMVGAASGGAMSMRRLREGIEHLTPEEAKRVNPLLRIFADMSRVGYDLVTEMTIQAVEALATETGRS